MEKIDLGVKSRNYNNQEKTAQNILSDSDEKSWILLKRILAVILSVWLAGERNHYDRVYGDTAEIIEDCLEAYMV